MACCHFPFSILVEDSEIWSFYQLETSNLKYKNLHNWWWKKGKPTKFFFQIWLFLWQVLQVPFQHYQFTLVMIIIAVIDAVRFQVFIKRDVRLPSIRMSPWGHFQGYRSCPTPWYYWEEEKGRRKSKKKKKKRKEKEKRRIWDFEVFHLLASCSKHRLPDEVLRDQYTFSPEDTH